MKAKYLYLLFFICACSYAQGQTVTADTARSKVRGVIKFFPLQLLVGEARFAYELPVNRHISLEISPGFVYGLIDGETDGNVDLDKDNNLNTRYKGFAVRGSVKFYTSRKKDLAGFYFSPLFLFKYAHASYPSTSPLYQSETEDPKMYAIQLLMGYKFQCKSRITVEPYVGAGYKEVFDKFVFHDPAEALFNGPEIESYFTFQLGISVGYLFKKK